MSATTARPVVAGDRVNDVLSRDEGLVDVFVRHSAHFNKLRNRAMRRIMGRLVTVEDASRMAAVPLASLLRDLNEALGITTPGAASGSGEPTPTSSSQSSSTAVPATHPVDATVMEVDVREDLRHGREPLARILAAVGALGSGEVLQVRAVFEPVPLFTLLGKRGFLHESVEHTPDDWSVWFWRADAAGPSSGPDADAAQVKGAVDDIGTPDDSTTVWLDVRGLQPPEPLMRTLAALEALPEGHQLVHVNSRVPQLLLPMLAERGFACALDESHADRVLLRIWRSA